MAPPDRPDRLAPPATNLSWEGTLLELAVADSGRAIAGRQSGRFPAISITRR